MKLVSHLPSVALHALVFSALSVGTVACGGSSSPSGANPSAGGSSTTTAGGTSSGVGGSSSSTAGGTNSSSGGSSSTTGGTGNVGSGTCAEPETYSGPALTTGEWVDVTGSLTAVNNIWSVPNQDKILAAGGAGQGLSAYSAATNTWTPLAGTAGMDVFAVVFDPCNGNRFWIAANGGTGGAFYTEDGGATVTKLGTVPGLRGIGVDLKTTNGQVLVAAASVGWPWDAGTGQLWVSADGGTTWTEKTDLFTATNGTPFGYVHAVDDQVLLASTIENGTFDGGGSKGGIWISTDSGGSWAQAPYQDPPRCSGYAWCGYSNWNQPIGQPFVRSNGELWWINAWYNSMFITTDNGAHWWDTWGEYTHTLQGGGGHPIEIPVSYLPADAANAAGDPGIISIDHELESGMVASVKISYYQPDKDGPGLWWWADFLDYPVEVDGADTTDHTDHLAFDAVAGALFVSTKNGGGLVWMQALAP